MSVFLSLFMCVITLYSLRSGPTDLSMKSLASNSSSSSSSSLGRNGGGASAQLSHTEVAAVRQLIAGYRESAAFLLRSADELENLILQQNWTRLQRALSLSLGYTQLTHHHPHCSPRKSIWLLKRKHAASAFTWLQCGEEPLKDTAVLKLLPFMPSLCPSESHRFLIFFVFSYFKGGQSSWRH